MALIKVQYLFSSWKLLQTKTQKKISTSIIYIDQFWDFVIEVTWRLLWAVPKCLLYYNNRVSHYSVFVVHPTNQTSVAQGLFLGGSFSLHSSETKFLFIILSIDKDIVMDRSNETGSYNACYTEKLAQSVEAVEYTDCISAEGVRPPLMSVQDMTLNNIMVRLQWWWRFGECRVPLHCHCTQVHSGPEW